MKPNVEIWNRILPKSGAALAPPPPLYLSPCIQLETPQSTETL